MYVNSWLGLLWIKTSKLNLSRPSTKSSCKERTKELVSSDLETKTNSRVRKGGKVLPLLLQVFLNSPRRREEVVGGERQQHLLYSVDDTALET